MTLKDEAEHDALVGQTIVQMQAMHYSSRQIPSLYARSLPLNLTAWPYFCSLVMS